jgi:hypothetical protein
MAAVGLSDTIADMETLAKRASTAADVCGK